ncbi:hypothetical protein GE061_012412 [Apolygus lucorum]|uniref:Uncharacterized protein n=1 Tax=Apolygus lucorum TaxID=248454 RepID=A0A6A4K0F0_APOLU|nr:hypothetical protein GE061_012412 [Apolygus lucorum]
MPRHFNPAKVTERVPDTNNNNSADPEQVDQALISLLKEMRGVDEPRAVRKRKTRLNVEAGKSVSLETSESSEDDLNQCEDNNSVSFEDAPNHGEENSVFSDDDENQGVNDCEISENSGAEEEMDTGDINLDHLVSNDDNIARTSAQNKIQCEDPFIVSPGDFIIANFETNRRQRRHVAQINGISDGGTLQIKCLRKKVGKKDVFFVFPDVEDSCELFPKNVERVLKLRRMHRGHHYFGVDPKNLE